MNDRITLRLGDLAEPMTAKITATGETPSEYIRRLIARDCKVEAPEMVEGNPNAGEQASAANAARWKRSRKKKRPRA